MQTLATQQWMEHALLMARRAEGRTSPNPPVGAVVESIAAMSERVTSFAMNLCAAHPGQTAIIVSHVGPVKALVTATLGIKPQHAGQMFLDPATVSVIDWSADKRILRLFNSHAHLRWSAARWMT